ncbi:hypothetical protein NDU88_003024 [Pleurodeles waltl]|uniref:Uncharacterized protein n=1 Tax=Pleurodeles waltl TaxID=8319 RepID=A0AAV7UXA5_PLEWA|nr:hypothetical protein NDU88_003024 [Pleurodeles waltl]
MDCYEHARELRTLKIFPFEVSAKYTVAKRHERLTAYDGLVCFAHRFFFSVARAQARAQMPQRLEKRGCRSQKCYSSPRSPREELLMTPLFEDDVCTGTYSPRCVRVRFLVGGSNSNVAPLLVPKCSKVVAVDKRRNFSSQIQNRIKL